MCATNALRSTDWRTFRLFMRAEIAIRGIDKPRIVGSVIEVIVLALSMAYSVLDKGIFGTEYARGIDEV